MIAGLGTDIVEIDRLRKALQRHPDAFAARAFTPAERQKAEGQRNPEPYLAGRWAAKEAIAKALGVGFGAHCRWQDLEITNDDQGKPEVEVTGDTLAYMQQRGIDRLHLSISHEHHYAVATAIAETSP